MQVLLVPASPIHLINLAFTIAAFVYLADVRPALAPAPPLTVAARRAAIQ